MGSQEANLKAMVAERGLESRVIFTGRVPHGDVQRYYDLIDVLAYPRHRMRLTEIVTPLKPLEAMAQGRMFVASDVGGHRELVRDGETGFLFPAGDAAALARALESVLERKADWPRIREQARRFVETERTWARSVSSLRRTVRSAPIGAGPPRSASQTAAVVNRVRHFGPPATIGHRFARPVDARVNAPVRARCSYRDGSRSSERPQAAAATE